MEETPRLSDKPQSGRSYLLPPDWLLPSPGKQSLVARVSEPLETRCLPPVPSSVLLADDARGHF